jgi:twitching motility protein PilT
VALALEVLLVDPAVSSVIRQNQLRQLTSKMQTSKGKGRVAVHEILVKTRSVSNLIRDGETNRIPGVIQTGRAQGMILMADSLEALLKEKKIPGHDAYMKATNKERFAPFAAE